MAPRVPHTLVLPEAKQADVARLVREVLEAKGARLDEQTRARIVFEGLPVQGGFHRGGYAGTYQAVGEKGVEVLVEATATAPRRAFWGVVILELLLVPLLFALSPPSAVFFVASLVLWGLLVLVAVLHYLTFRVSRELEEELHAALTARLREAGLAPLDEEQQLERSIRERLEGELKEREVAARPPPPKRARERKPGLFGRPKE